MTDGGRGWRRGAVGVLAALAVVGCAPSADDTATDVAACGDPTSTVEYDRVSGLGALPVARS